MIFDQYPFRIIIGEILIYLVLEFQIFILMRVVEEFHCM